MTIIVDKETNIIIEIASSVTLETDKLFVKSTRGFDYYICNLEDVLFFENATIPDGVEIQKFCYSESNGFYKNDNYTDHLVPEQKIENLQTELLNTKLAMAELVEQQQADKLSNQLALAELIESIMEGGTTA